MGKAALLMVLASTIIMVGVTSTRATVEFELSEIQANYEEKVLAREAATSFFNVLASSSINDFDGFRISKDQLSYGDAIIDFSVVGNSTNELGLTTVAYVGNASHTVGAIVVRTGGSVLDAVTIDGPINKVDAKGSKFLLTGYDTNPGGAIGSGPKEPTFGLRATAAETASKLTDKINGSQITGKNGTNSITTGSSPVDLDELYDDIMSHPDRIVLSGNQKFEDGEVFGSPYSPVVMIVNGKMELKNDTKGYGILLVNGTLKMDQGATWEGLVFANNQGGKHEFKGSSAIYGALVLRTVAADGSSGEDLGLPGGHFDVDVFNGVTTDELYHEHQYDDKYDRTYVDLLSATCKTNGGLCWNDIVKGGGYGTVRVVVANPEMSSGIINFETDTFSTEESQSPAEGLDQTFQVTDLKKFRITFDSLCSLRGTEPKYVQSDTSNRDGAISIQVYDVDSAGSPLIYELSVYHHIPKEYSGCSEDESEEVAAIPATPLEFKIEADVQISYSSVAMARLPGFLPSLDIGGEVITLESIREVASQRKRLSDGSYSLEEVTDYRDWTREKTVDYDDQTVIGTN